MSENINERDALTALVCVGRDGKIDFLNWKHIDEIYLRDYYYLGGKGFLTMSKIDGDLHIELTKKGREIYDAVFRLYEKLS